MIVKSIIVLALLLFPLFLFGQEKSEETPVYDTPENKEGDFSLPEFKTIIYQPVEKGDFVFALSPYLFILDQEGDPVFFRKIEDGVRNFQLQKNGLLTYYNNVDEKFFVLDTYYQVIDSFRVVGNYSTDFHSLQILPHGHALLMATDLQQVDMSKLIPGGDPKATVASLILQEVDASHQLLFQWRSWDHFAITDADTTLVDLTSSVIDYVHANDLEITPDSNYLITCRNMSEVTKINRQTGEIMWRCGGKHNQFEMPNDTVDIHAMHSARLLDETHLLLFDNGLTSRSDSRGLEYFIDQNKKIIRLLRTYPHDPPVFSPVMGNIQVMNASQRLIGWGKNDGGLICTVYDTLADPLMEIKPGDQDPYWSYHVSFGEWRDSVLRLPVDSLMFTNLMPGDSALMIVPVINSGKDTMVLNGFSVADHCFFCLSDFPRVLPVKDSLNITVQFKPGYSGEYASSLLLFFNPLNISPSQERIVRKVKVYGQVSTDYNKEYKGQEKIRIMPNPAKNQFIPLFKGKMNRMVISDVSGKVLYIQDNPVSGRAVKVDFLQPGIYFIGFITDDTRRRVITLIKI